MLGRIFRLMDFFQSLPDLTPAQQADPRGLSFVSIALSQIGQVKSRVGIQDPDNTSGPQVRKGWERLNEYFLTAYGSEGPGHFSTNDVRFKKNTLQSWCGIFILWAAKSAGLTSAVWQSTTIDGYLEPEGWKRVNAHKKGFVPRPGDIGLFGGENQRRNIIVAVNGDTITTVDGNTDAGGGAMVAKLALTPAVAASSPSFCDNPFP